MLEPFFLFLLLKFHLKVFLGFLSSFQFSVFCCKFSSYFYQFSPYCFVSISWTLFSASTTTTWNLNKCFFVATISCTHFSRKKRRENRKFVFIATLQATTLYTKCLLPCLMHLFSQKYNLYSLVVAATVSINFHSNLK